MVSQQQLQQLVDECKGTGLMSVWPATQLICKRLFFLLAGLALARHSGPVEVQGLPVAPPQLHCQRKLPQQQQETSTQQQLMGHDLEQTSVSKTLTSQHVRRQMLWTNPVQSGKLTGTVLKPCCHCNALAQACTAQVTHLHQASPPVLVRVKRLLDQTLHLCNQADAILHACKAVWLSYHRLQCPSRQST